MRSIAPFGCAPMTETDGSPSRNRIIVGIEAIPKRSASSRSSSMLTLTSFSPPACSSTMRSRTGATAWHGPHHSAQKSTSTGTSLWITSCSNVSFLTAVDIESFRCVVLVVLYTGRTTRGAGCSRSSLESHDVRIVSGQTRPRRASSARSSRSGSARRRSRSCGRRTPTARGSASSTAPSPRTSRSPSTPPGGAR